jgi:hypothetical protein
MKVMDRFCVLINPDGEFLFLGEKRLLDTDFPTAADAAAKNLKFTPAVHKKSKQPVSQAIMVEYTFKP